jgi:hypothetical protein
MLAQQPAKTHQRVPRIVLIRLAAVGRVAPSQFVDEALQMRGLIRRVGAKNLLEALAYGIADRSAELVIERFDVICG